LADGSPVTRLLLTGGASEHPGSAIDRWSLPLIRSPLPVLARSALARNIGAAALDAVQADVRRSPAGAPR